jgi:glycine cleavage system H lipoate-binding protein
MFPGVDGFHWTAGHLIFLGTFFGVLGTIAATVVTASVRAGRDGRARKIAQLSWHRDFHDLPERDRVCRHELTGEFKHRVCKFRFGCCECETHAGLIAQQPEIPPARMYHRGHTWAEAGTDGTFTIGLDELGTRLIGKPDVLELPPVGSRLEVNGAAWRIEKNGAGVRLLSPVAGEVIETADAEESGWYLKVRPTDPRTGHLLRGAEVDPWMRREMDKLQLLLADESVGASLADGGELLAAAGNSCPPEKWDTVLGAMFLES